MKFKKKRLFAFLLTMLMVLSAVGCGNSEIDDQSSEDSQVTEAEITESETEEVTEEETEADEEISEENTSIVAESEDFTPVEGLSENYADLENRCFAYNSKIFTLGESTFQDLIDGGIPFSENDLNNVGNNVNSNYETSYYTAEINDYVYIQFTFINTTDSNITEAECLLQNVRWYTLYVPKPDYEDSLNETISSMISDASNYVCFSFPLTLTKDQLLENNSDITEETENNSVKYTVDSEVYMGTSGYTFEFDKDTNQLKEVSISWLP